MNTFTQLDKLQEVYRDISQMIGYENMLLLYDYYKGQQLSFPMRLYSKEYLLEKLQGEYNGRNIRQLARETGYSERWIRRLIKQNGGTDNE